MGINQENLEKILTLLNNRLALVSPDKKWRLVACGGSALNALKLVSRTTKDVDVIGKLSNNTILYADLDPSEGFRCLLISMLRQLEYHDVAEKV